MSEQTVSYGWISPSGSERQGMSFEDAQRDISTLYRKGYVVFLSRFIDGKIDESFEGENE